MSDDSGEGLGTVLTQKQDDGSVKPIAFASRTLQAHHHNYSVTEMETLSVVWDVQQFRHYLYGHRYTVFTDHEALQSLLNTPPLREIGKVVGGWTCRSLTYGFSTVSIIELN